MKTILSIICGKKLKYSLILLFLFALYTGICAYSYACTVSSGIEDSVFRLHVLANSDSEEDQNLKYMVRDKLIEYMNTLCKDVSSKEKAIEIAKEHEADFKNIAVQTILDNGYPYDVTVEIGNFEFPTKTYGDIAFPSGYYDALRVKIGNASGKNWWCVMFPPLCFVNVSSGIVPDESKDLIKDELSTEEYSIISGDSTEIKFKFKILEWFQNTKDILTAKN